jgi:alpha-D-xyloside xylohydrolase
MQLHGRSNITPWTVPDRVDETVAMYRYFATLHHELVPFFYSLAEEAYAGGPTIIRPVDDEPAWPGDWRFQVGEAFLVAPILAHGGVRDVLLPEGVEYFDFFDPRADPVSGGTLVTGYDASAWGRLPVFVREGAIVPLEVSSETTGLGTAASAGLLTVLVWPGAAGSSFVLHETDGATTTITAHGALAHAGISNVKLSRVTRGTILRVCLGMPPSGVQGGGGDLPACADRAGLDAVASGYWLEPDTSCVWIKIPPGTGEYVAETIG